jgi:hypothetical protein
MTKRAPHLVIGLSRAALTVIPEVRATLVIPEFRATLVIPEFREAK